MALSLLLILGAAGTGRGQVMIVHAVPNPAYVDDVRAKLEASELLDHGVTTFNAAAATPTLTELQAVAAVLVFSDTGFASPPALGTVLADYVDGGGGVVEAVFANTDSLGPGGRWVEDSYSPFIYDGQTQGTRLTLGPVAEPLHPAMAGVTTFDGGSSSYRTTGTLRPAARLIASWSNEEPLVAEMPGRAGRVLSLNFYPPSSAARADFWESDTDGVRLLANSLNYVAVPEPATLVLLLLGGPLVVLLARRRRG